MNYVEQLAAGHYLSDYPDGWSFKRVIDHLYYEYDESPMVQIREVFQVAPSEEIGALIQRYYIRLASGVQE